MQSKYSWVIVQCCFAIATQNQWLTFQYVNNNKVEQQQQQQQKLDFVPTKDIYKNSTCIIYYWI